MCAAFPGATGFSEGMGSAAMVRELGLQAPSLLFPQFYFLLVFQSTHI